MEKRLEKIKNFIELIKNFDTKNLSRGKYIFNPWTEFDESDLNNAHKIRCENLEKYLIQTENADCILIAESPSKGARYTGIAMTSEKVINDFKLPFQYTSCNYSKYKKGEITAGKVWQEISKSKKSFALWNAFAFNIHKEQDKWFENPLEEELIENKYILESFINLYPNAKIIAIGNTAKKALDILKIEDVECVRHPSNDFKKEFPKQIAKFL